MTPKQLLEKHNGNPLEAVHTSGSLVQVMETIRLAVRARIVFDAKDAVTKTIAHLGEDGAERWGRALAEIVIGADACAPDSDIWHIPSFQLTRIANAADRERLAACIVALAEGEDGQRLGLAEVE